MPEINEAKIYISCGDDRSLGVDGEGNLLVQHTWWQGGNLFKNVINLGKLTDDRIEELKGYLDRLRHHA